ncbi:hypothetical protein GCM10027046_30620 [Uliginosibacterium flavum]|uniref:Uncharacterized protein n=1 Tax=Uliginosibacterium flavum TaxID=1396831 RepID=A0ABV2TIR0_9RHOO
MILAELIRKKEPSATATPATSATSQRTKPATVARIAIVAVAKPPAVNAGMNAARPRPLFPVEEDTIRAWLTVLGEADPVIINEVLHVCRSDVSARDYYLERSRPPSVAPNIEDDRRTCNQCAQLSHKGRCLAAQRREIAASPNYEPIRDLPRRCEGYKPGPDDNDRRTGRVRWPFLVTHAD